MLSSKDFVALLSIAIRVSRKILYAPDLHVQTYTIASQKEYTCDLMQKPIYTYGREFRPPSSRLFT